MRTALIAVDRVDCRVVVASDELAGIRRRPTEVVEMLVPMLTLLGIAVGNRVTFPPDLRSEALAVSRKVRACSIGTAVDGSRSSFVRRPTTGAS